MAAAIVAWVGPAWGSQSSGRAGEGVCTASRLGQPCPVGDTAAMGAPGPALSLGAGNPVHLVTGNKYQREVDLPAMDAGVGLEIVRHYNAQDPRAGVLGRGWTLSYDTRLHAQAMQGRIQIAQADGSRVDFRCGDGDTCVAIPPHAGALRTLGHGWQWRWPNGRMLTFDAAGRLVRIEDPDGKSVRIARDGGHGAMAGRILEVADTHGRSLRFTYASGSAGIRISRIDTPAGSYAYQHDAPHHASQSGRPAFRLLAVQHPAGWLREYVYETALQGGDAYRLTGIAWRPRPGGPSLRTHSWAYDARGRAVLSVHGPPESPRDRVEIGYIAEPRERGHAGLTRVRSADGSTTDFHTRLHNGRAVLTAVEGAGCAGCPAAGLRADYDDAGRLTRLDGLRLARDGHGRLKALQAAASGWPGLALAFDAQGRSNGWTSNHTGTETRRRDAAGRIAERRYANGDVWRYTYDREGRLVEVIAQSAAAALRTAIAWRGARPVRVDHPHESETRRHDRKGQLISRIVRRPAIKGRNPAYAYRESFRWDERGRLVRHELPEGGSLIYAYDATGRISRIAWENGVHKRTLLQSAADGGYLYGNGLRARGALSRDGIAALAVDDPASPDADPVFAQRLRYDGAGRIASERLRIGDWRARFDHLYDAQGRMAATSLSTRSGQRAGGTQWRHAWHPAGDAMAVQAGARTWRPRPVRDASGLPIAHDGAQMAHGADRRLSTVRRAGAIVAEYVHNAYGERIRRHGKEGAAAGTTDYLYAANRLAAVARPGSKGRMGVTQRYVYAGWVPVALIEYAASHPLAPMPARAPVPAFYAVHADAIGVPHAITDAQRRVRWRALWSPAGAEVAIEGDLSMPLRQPGHVYDAATGWHDNYLRTYDPHAGHYLQPDPAGPMPDTQVYGYADQQPRRHIDPLGLLLFAFDGTNHDEAARGNVWVMSRGYAGGPAHYHRGPGFASPRSLDAATAGSAPDIVHAQWRTLLREIAAAGHEGQVAIDLLGYSRGAALALHFGNLIAGRHRGGRFWTWDRALGAVTACADLRFIGLFDAVAQFGILGADNEAYDLGVAAEWRWVAHAVALHERRTLFPLSAIPDGAANTITAPFIGAHGDIGGGYLREPADIESGRPGGDLSDVALAWMLKQAHRAGAPFHGPPAPYRRVDNPILHDHRFRVNRLAGTDRPVLDGDGDTLLEAQGEHSDYGERARIEVEAFIRRVDNWTWSSTEDVATVDMDGYRGWLRDTLGLHAAP